METLFSEPAEASLTPKGRTESSVKWLRRSTTESACRSRQLLNAWLEPLADDTDLLQRIVGDDQSFRGAFLETYLNACFRQAGWNVGERPSYPARLGDRSGPIS